MIKTSASLFLRTFAPAFFLLLLPVIPAFAQGADTVYYNKDGEKLKTKTAPDADYFVISIFNDATKSAVTEKSFYISGEKKSEDHFTINRSDDLEVRQRTGQELGWYKNGQVKHKRNYVGGKEVGPDTMWFENGQIKHISLFSAGKKEGEAISYYPDGKLKRREKFANGRLVTGKCFTKAGADTVYFPAETIPVFKEGEPAMHRFLAQNIKYPKAALKKGIEGVVVVQFMVDTTGKISDPKVVRKVSPELDAEGFRIVQLMSGRFKPATLEGRPLPFKYTLPLRFGIQ